MLYRQKYILYYSNINNNSNNTTINNTTINIVQQYKYILRLLYIIMLYRNIYNYVPQYTYICIIAITNAYIYIYIYSVY